MKGAGASENSEEEEWNGGLSNAGYQQKTKTNKTNNQSNKTP